MSTAPNIADRVLDVPASAPSECSALEVTIEPTPRRSCHADVYDRLLAEIIPLPSCKAALLAVLAGASLDCDAAGAKAIMGTLEVHRSLVRAAEDGRPLPEEKLRIIASLLDWRAQPETQNTESVPPRRHD